MEVDYCGASVDPDDKAGGDGKKIENGHLFEFEAVEELEDGVANDHK